MRKLTFLNLEPENFSLEAKKKLKKTTKYVERKLNQKELLKEIHKFDILYLRFSVVLDKKVLTKAKNLKFILCNATGIDHIDQVFAEKLGIQIISLKNQPLYLKKITASSELSWALIQSITRKIPFAFEDVKNNRWERERFLGMQLSGKNIGILGMGRNGKLVSKYALSFGMKIHFYDQRDIKTNKNFFKHDSLISLLKEIDILSIHLPLNDNTVNLLNYKVLKNLKKGSFIINTSRGEIINEEDLISLLDSGYIKAAALDVISDEKNFKRNKLIKYSNKNKNLLITPHIGGATYDSWANTENFVVDKLIEKLKNDN